MSNDFIYGIYIVRVNMIDRPGGRSHAFRFWAAFMDSDKAVDAVRAAVPAHWQAELTSERLTEEQFARIGLKPGEVRELTS